MLFFFGAIDGETGYRHVLVGTAWPTIESMEDLTDGGEPFLTCDWGDEASDVACCYVAQLLLSKIRSNGVVTPALISLYASDVVRKMTSAQKWMITEQDIEDWLLMKQRTN